ASSLSSNHDSPVAEAGDMGSAAGPLMPVLLIAALFEKRVFLDKGVWHVVQTAEDLTLDQARLQAAQERYIADRNAAQAELCTLLASKDYPDWQRLERVETLAQRSGFDDLGRANLLRDAGAVDAAIEGYKQVLSSKPSPPCSSTFAVFRSPEPDSLEAHHESD